jgi:hypothetical protein
LVERLAIAQYRLRRIARIEAGCLDLRLRFQPMPEGYSKDGRADPLAWAFLSDCQGGRSWTGWAAMRAASSASIPAA